MNAHGAPADTRRERFRALRAPLPLRAQGTNGGRATALTHAIPPIQVETPAMEPPGSAREAFHPVAGRRPSDQAARTMAQRVADRLRSAILEGELQAGQPLKQAELAARFGVSPIPLREALGQLQAEGFVILHPYRGARVASLAAAEVRDLADVFLALQSLALRLAIATMDPKVLRHARFVLETMRETDDPERWGSLVGEFHLTLAFGAVGRPCLLATIRGLLVNLSRYRLLGVTRVEYRRRSERRSAEILDACERGDVVAAVRILQDHVATISSEAAASLSRC